MAAFDPTAAEVFVSTDDHFVASYRSLLIQVRRGPLTPALLDRLESVARSLRARESGGAFIGVLEESADLPRGEVRARRLVLVKQLFAHERSFAVTVVPTTTARGALRRTFLRMMAFASPRRAVCGRPIDAGRWLEKRVKIPALETTAFIDWSRSRRLIHRRE